MNSRGDFKLPHDTKSLSFLRYIASREKHQVVRSYKGGSVDYGG
jgi:hypothetical protein